MTGARASPDPRQHPACLPTLWPAVLSLSSPGFIKVLLYMAFMTIMIKVHTFPLFAIRPMYLAMRWVQPVPSLSQTALPTCLPALTDLSLQAVQESCDRRHHVSPSHPQHEHTVSGLILATLSNSS